MTEQDIPEIAYSDNKVVLPTLKVPIRFNGEMKEITMRKLPAGKRSEIIKKHVNPRIQGQNLSTDIQDFAGIQTSILAECIVEAPFEVSEKIIKELPENVVDYLYSEYQKWSKKKPN
jgi:hypothetical protein